MDIVFICKRLYTNRDLFGDRFGRLFHLPVQLGKRGHQVTVIAFDYHAGRPREELVIEGVKFVSIPVVRMPDTAMMILRLYSELRRATPNVLIASGDTYIAALTALFARSHRIPWVFDIYDDYRCFASARLPGMKTLFWRLVGRADQVVVASSPLKTLISRSTNRVATVENGVDPELFRTLDKLDCRDKLGIPADDSVVGFFGSIERKRGVEILIQAFQKLRGRNAHLRLLLAGRNRLELYLEQPGIDYRGPVSQSAVPIMINACDVVVIPYEKDPQVDVSNACKISEYIACGIPIVATRVSNMEDLFSQTPEILTEPSDSDGLAAKITLQLERRITIPFIEKLSWSNLGQRVEQLLLALEKPNEQAR